MDAPHEFKPTPRNSDVLLFQLFEMDATLRDTYSGLEIFAYLFTKCFPLGSDQALNTISYNK